MSIENQVLQASRPIKEVVNELRKEISELQEESANKDIKFELGEVEVELQVGLTVDGGGKLGFDCFFYKAEAGANVERATTHTVRLKLTPKNASGRASEEGADSLSELVEISAGPAPYKGPTQ